MAEAIMRKLAIDRNVALEVRSAGVSASDGMPVSGHAVQALERRSAVAPAQSNALRAETVDWADLILTMTSGHKQTLLFRYPEAVHKTYTLKEYAHQDEPEYRAILEELQGLYAAWELKTLHGESLTPQERSRMIELQRQLPSTDIADPFGGSGEIYEGAAQEIEDAIQRVLDKLEQVENHGDEAGGAEG
jgi:protein-tyrosine phosphatase